VLDLGAGTGALTAPLLRTGAVVLAVELDEVRAAALRRRFAGRAVTVIRTDLADLRLPRRPFRVVANPPYSSASALVRLLLGHDRMLAADLVLQTAAARRLAADPPGRHAHRYELTPGTTVPRRAFVPAPTVDSVLLRIRRR